MQGLLQRACTRTATRCALPSASSSSSSSSACNASSATASFQPSRNFTTNLSPLASASSSSATPVAYDLVQWGGGKDMKTWVTSLRSDSTNPLAQKSLQPRYFPSPDQSGFIDISFGHEHAAFVTGNGALYTYGRGPALGHGAKVTALNEPRRVEGLPAIAAVACGKAHTIALARNGEVFTFGKAGGFTTTDALGGSTKDSSLPGLVSIANDSSADPIVQIAAGSYHNMVRTKKGRVYGFGSGANGRLGTGGSGGESKPILLAALAHLNITHISCGSSFNGALDDSGNIWMFGKNEKGQLGLGTSLILDQYSMESVPTRVEFTEEFELGKKIFITDVACAYKHTLAITTQGHLYEWGRGQFVKPRRMLGDNNDELKNEKFTGCAGGNDFSLAMTSDGSLASWGSSSSGCLAQGDGYKVFKQPQFIRGFGPSAQAAGANEHTPWLGQVKKIFAGLNHAAVLTTKK